MLSRVYIIDPGENGPPTSPTALKDVVGDTSILPGVGAEPVLVNALRHTFPFHLLLVRSDQEEPVLLT